MFIFPSLVSIENDTFRVFELVPKVARITTLDSIVKKPLVWNRIST